MRMTLDKETLCQTFADATPLVEQVLSKRGIVVHAYCRQNLRLKCILGHREKPAIRN